MPKAIHLMPVGGLPLAFLDELAASLARTFRVSCHVRDQSLDAAFAYNPQRKQHHSTQILERLQPIANGQRLLAVTSHDLFVPILTFVFGEAQLQGGCAVVSLHRLREESYGLEPNPDLLRERLLKEAVHELGHTYGLRHCPDWRCVMASSHGVERLDVKLAEFCARCRMVVDAG